MLPFLNIFGLALPLAPFTYLLGIWFGLSLAEKYSLHHKIKPAILYNLVFTGLIVGVIGARLSYVARFPEAFISDPASLISINFGLFDLQGGVVVGLLAVLVYGQRKNLSLWPTLDALTPFLAILMLAIPLANLASGFAYGVESDLPWAINLWGASRHPTQIYEALGAGLILWFIWPSRLPEKRIPGITFLKFIAITAVARLFFEIFRGDSLMTVYNIRWAQVISWLIAAAAFWAINNLSGKKGAKMSLAGKTILITGAAVRVGQAMALAAADAGANLILHYNSSADGARDTLNLVKAKGVKAEILQANLNNNEALSEAYVKAIKFFGPIDILINNAAIFEPLDFLNTDIEDWQRHLQINLTAPFILSQAFAKNLPNDKKGRILNILDWRALRPGADHFPYTISKAGLSALTQSLAVSLAPRVSVNGIALGAILPPSDGGNSDSILKDVPYNRWAKLEELGETMLFLLAGPEYITGEIIHLDGGRHLI